MSTLYIAGPMTGLPDLNYPEFNRVAKQLKALGYFVLNPVENDDGTEHDWNWYMRASLHQVARAHGIALLPGWENSKGAELEVLVAGRLEMPVRDWWDWRGES